MNSTYIKLFTDGNWSQLNASLSSSSSLNSDPLYKPFLGISSHHLGKHNVAIEYLSEVPQHSDMFIDSFIYLGLSCIALRKYSQAIQAFLSVFSSIDSSDLRISSVLLNLTNCYAQNGDIPNALNFNRLAILFSPTAGMNYFLLSHLYQDLSKSTRALKLTITDGNMPSFEFREAINKLYSRGEEQLSTSYYIRYINNIELSTSI